MESLASLNLLDLIEIESKPPKFSQKEILGVLPEDTLKPYDTYELISRIVDNSEIDEYKAGYGKTLITAYAQN